MKRVASERTRLTRRIRLTRLPRLHPITSRARIIKRTAFQFPEKLIPLTILNAIADRDLRIYGDGGNVRDWLFVEDHCEGIVAVLERRRIGESYNIGGNSERTNLEVVAEASAALEELMPSALNPALAARGMADHLELRTLVPDRPGQDRPHAVDCSRIERELG